MKSKSQIAAQTVYLLNCLTCRFVNP